MSDSSPGRHGGVGSTSSAENASSKLDTGAFDADEAADAALDNEELLATDPLDADSMRIP